MKTIILILCLVWVSPFAYSQLENRLRPGVMYEAGQIVYAPRFGFKSKIPQGWEGTLPREAEVFLLMPVSPVAAEIYVLGNENDSPEALKMRWTQGIDMGSGITLRAHGAITQRGAAIAAEGDLSGSTNKAGRRIYAEARCSEFGICVSCVLVADNNSFEAAKKAFQVFVDDAVFDLPRNVSIYEGFDWKKFLTDQMLVSYEANEKATKLNEIHLCHDGTFQSSIKRKGLLKEDVKQYQGKKKGTWSIDSGQTSALKLVFKDGSRAEIELRIDDDKVFANGVRHFVAYSDRCITEKKK